MPQQRYTGFFQLSLSLWSRDYPPLALEISVVLLAIREELRDLLKLEKKSCMEMHIRPSVGLKRVKGS